jgi:DNA-binding transcriptional LysR family regulator
MELRQLKYFAVLAEELHFTQAAERLRIAQPSLSRQIKRLEQELKIRLFRRTKRRVELTQAGELFLPRALETLRQAELSALTAQRAGRGELGLVQIGTISSMPFMGLLPKILHAYRLAYPHVHVVLQEQNTKEQLKNLYEGALDVGFLRLPIRDLPSRISVQSLCREPVYVALREDHPLASAPEIDLRRLSSEPFIMYPYDIGGGLHDLSISICNDAGFVPRIEQEAKTVSMAVSFAAAGLGAALVPASSRNIHTPGVVYRPLKRAFRNAEVAIAHRLDDYSARVKAFVELSLSLRAPEVASKQQ